MLLDKLLPRLFKQESRVLIFSQMTRCEAAYSCSRGSP